MPDGDFTKATIEAVIDESTIDTGVADRDAHLESPDFFDVAQFPEARFTSSKFAPQEDAEGRLLGNLRIKGITARCVAHRASRANQRSMGHERAACSAKTSIDRKDFGLNWNQALETGGLMVGNAWIWRSRLKPCYRL